eukprot:m.46328 g.46328  ORF g.46328 m.46328 type:complete len:54 (+) comp12237_c0_seq1:82-243(+)
MEEIETGTVWIKEVQPIAPSLFYLFDLFISIYRIADPSIALLIQPFDLHLLHR